MRVSITTSPLDLRELIGDAFERGALPSGGGAEPQRARELALAAHEQPRAVIVFLEGRVGAARHGRAAGQPIDRAALETLLELDRRPVCVPPQVSGKVIRLRVPIQCGSGSVRRAP